MAEKRKEKHVHVVPFLMSDEPDQSRFNEDTRHRIEALLAANYPEVIYGDDWTRQQRYRRLAHLWPDFDDFWKPYRTTFALEPFFPRDSQSARTTIPGTTG